MCNWFSFLSQSLLHFHRLESIKCLDYFNGAFLMKINCVNLSIFRKIIKEVAQSHCSLFVHQVQSIHSELLENFWYQIPKQHHKMTKDYFKNDYKLEVFLWCEKILFQTPEFKTNKQLESFWYKISFNISPCGVNWNAHDF